MLAQYKSAIIEAIVLLLVFGVLLGMNGGSDPRSKIPWLFSFSVILLLSTAIYAKNQMNKGKLKTILSTLLLLPISLLMVSTVGFAIGLLIAETMGIHTSVKIELCPVVFMVLLLMQSVMLFVGRSCRERITTILSFVVAFLVTYLQFDADYLDLLTTESPYLVIGILFISMIMIVLYLIMQHSNSNESITDNNKI